MRYLDRFTEGRREKLFFGVEPARARMRGHMASAKREPVTGVWGGAASGAQEHSPGSGVKGRSPLKSRGFQYWNVLKKRHFLGVLETLP